MKNSNKSRSIQKSEKTDNRSVFNEWHNKAIQNAVTEGMQLVHRIINEEFSAIPEDLEKSRCILNNTIEKLVAVEKFTRLSCDSRCDDDLPF